MGFLVGSSSSCFLQPSLSYPLSSSTSSRSIFFHSSSPKNAEPKRRGTVPMASMNQDDSSYRSPLQRRAILFVGISVLPLLQLRARALDGLATSEQIFSCAFIYISTYMCMHWFVYFIWEIVKFVVFFLCVWGYESLVGLEEKMFLTISVCCFVAAQLCYQLDFFLYLILL